MIDTNQNNIYVDLGHGLSMLVGLPKLSSWETDERPKEPKRGTFGFNSKTNSLEYFNGSDWFAAKMSKT